MQAPISLTEIIKRDVSLRLMPPNLCCFRIEIAEYAIANASLGNPPELFFNRFQHLTRIGQILNIQYHRKQGSKPAHSAGEVNILKQVFPSMTL
ncbi:MAG: hypothetical protein AAF215_31630 [Cyanobacteria bacterium P01_A01_bin.123]